MTVSIVSSARLSHDTSNPHHATKETAKLEILSIQTTTPAILLASGSIKDRLKAVALERMKAICADSNLRLAGYSKKPSLLDKGIFYSTDYFRALKSIGKLGAKRFEFLFEQGAFIHGLAPKDFFSIKKSFPDHPHHSFHITGKVIRGYQIKEGVSVKQQLFCKFPNFHLHFYNFWPMKI